MPLHSKGTGSLYLLLLLALCLSACGGSNALSLYDPNVTPVIDVSPHLAATTLNGGAVWIHNCRSGWEAYAAQPMYRDSKGEVKPRDVYLYGHFWIQPTDGGLWNYNQQGRPDKEQCVESVLQLAHQYHAKVYGVLGIDLGSGGWTQDDVISYIQRAAQDARMLQPILQQLDRYHYDGLVNDIEAGDNQNPAAFTAYNTSLRRLLHSTHPQSLLGTTLIAKTTNLSTPWQNWQGLVATAVDFVVIMALDHDTIYPYPTPIVDTGWLQGIYSYLKQFPQLTVEWELPTYCRIWKAENGWSKQTCNYLDAIQLVHDVQIGKAGKIIDDHSKDQDNPYLHYTDTNGIESYLYFETLPSLMHQANDIQSLEGSQCLYLSFWDGDTGEPQMLWPTLDGQTAIKLC